MPHSRPIARPAALLAALGQRLIKLGVWVGQVSSWLVIGVMVTVLGTVTMNALEINQLFSWESSIPLLGQAFTINSMTELQWHLFGILTLLGGTYAMHSDTHVRVDLVYLRLSPRGRHAMDLIGHLVLLIPFCFLIAWLSIPLVKMSFLSGEQSNYGGLTDRYLIKAALPIGLSFLGLAAFGQACYHLAGLIDPRVHTEPSTSIDSTEENAHVG